MELWALDFTDTFNLDGKATILVRGATKDGQGQVHEIRFEADECDLEMFARDIRDKFRQLKDYRARRDQKNMEVFNQVSE